MSHGRPHVAGRRGSHLIATAQWSQFFFPEWTRAGAGYLTMSTGRDDAHVPRTSRSYEGTAAGHLTTTSDLQVV
jgi:hypothetical protein